MPVGREREGQMDGGRLAESVWLVGLVGLAAPAMGFSRSAGREGLGTAIAGALALAAAVSAAAGLSLLTWLLPMGLAAVHGLAWLAARTREPWSGLPRAQ